MVYFYVRLTSKQNPAQFPLMNAISPFLLDSEILEARVERVIDASSILDDAAKEVEHLCYEVSDCL